MPRHEHEFERFELQDERVWLEGESVMFSFPVWYVGYRCSCGEPGFAVPA